MSFYKDQNKVVHCHILSTRVVAFLLTMFLQYLCCVQGGDTYHPPTVPNRGYLDPLKGLGIGRPQAGIWIPMFFLHTIHCLIVFDPAVSAASGRHCILRLVAEYLKVLGVKRVTGPQNPGAPKCTCVIRLNILMIR